MRRELGYDWDEWSALDYYKREGYSYGLSEILAAESGHDGGSSQPDASNPPDRINKQGEADTDGSTYSLDRLSAAGFSTREIPAE